MGKKLNRAAVVRRKRKDIQQEIDGIEGYIDLLSEHLNPEDHGVPFGDSASDRKRKDKEIKEQRSKIRSLKLKLKNLGGKGGGGMYSPSKPLKDQSLLSMAKKRQM